MDVTINQTNIRRNRILTLIIPAFISFLFLLVILPYGPGISNDSLLYLECGNHLFSGNGFSVIGHSGDLAFASDRFPLYPILLKLFTSTGLSPVVFQFLLFFFFEYLLMKTLISFTDKGNELVVVFLALLSVCYPFILVFYNLWTESLFLILLLLITMRLHDDEKKFRFLLLLLALLSLTRLVGIAAGISIAVVLVRRKEFAKSIAALAFSLIPVIAWFIAGFYLANENSRQLSMHWMTPAMIELFFATLGSLFWGETIWQTIIGILLFVFPVILYAFRKQRYDNRVLSFLIFLYYIYPLLLFLSVSLIDYSTPMDERILAPQFLVLLLIAAQLLLKSKLTFLVKIAPLSLFIILTIAVHAKDYKKLIEYGYGFTSKETREFQFPREIKKLTKDRKWYTNSIHGVYYMTGKRSSEIPLKFEIHNNRPNPDYKREWQKQLKEIKDSSGIIIWIRSGAFEKSFISYEELKKMEGLTVIYDDWLCLIMKSNEPTITNYLKIE